MAKKKKISDQTIDTSFEERSSTKINKQSNKTTSYSFRILVRDKAPFEGTLSREDMELIHSMYSSQGGNVQVRTLAREFPQFTLNQMKQILRAFSITKASLPIAPHQLEEMTVEQASTYTLNLKEKTFLKKLEEDRIKFNEAKVKELTKSLSDLKEKFSNAKEIINGYTPKTYKDCNFKNFDSQSTLIVVLSDMHVGAYVSDYSIYANPYDQEELHRRFDTILNRLRNITESYDSIVVLNLGDSLDGYNGETTRGGHSLPQNMNDKEQVKAFLDEMLYFFKELNKFNLPISYYCVGEANHDGNYGWLANEKLATCLEVLYPETVKSYVFDQFINHVKIGDTTLILCHGKDNKDMFKNYPLTLDLKTESIFNEYIDYNRINTSNIVVIKGDLHQSAITYGKRFTYWSVGSIFGSSEWIHKNFGNTKAFCEYGILNHAFNDLTINRIQLN